MKAKSFLISSSDPEISWNTIQGLALDLLRKMPVTSILFLHFIHMSHLETTPSLSKGGELGAASVGKP